MHIVSSFTDYYDSAIGFGGVDKSIVYVRNKKETEERRYMYGNNQRLSRNRHLYYDTFLVFFCGKYYGGLRVEVRVPDDLYTPAYRSTVVFFYDFDKARAFLSNFGVELDDKPSKWYRHNVYTVMTNPEKHKKELLKEGEDEPDNPIRVRTNYKLIENARLADFNFQSVFDPFAAFQELQMYVSNTDLGETKEPKPIDDDIMRDMKGFDEMSFRQTSPGDKKRRRKENKLRKRNKNA